MKSKKCIDFIDDSDGNELKNQQFLSVAERSANTLKTLFSLDIPLK